jgi:quercetin dioxygenase-like cupin family protein
MNLTLKDHWEVLTPSQRRDKLMEFEELCKLHEPANGVEIVPRHFHCGGVYAREIEIPKGTALVGEIHTQDQINVVSKGSIRVATEEGVRIITAPCTFISPAGTKRAGYALEDTVWTVFHATKSKDQQEIRKQFIAPNYEELDKQLEQKNVVGSNSNSSNNYSVPDTTE